MAAEIPGDLQLQLQPAREVQSPVFFLPSASDAEKIRKKQLRILSEITKKTRFTT